MPRYKQSYGNVFSVELVGVQQALRNFKVLEQKARKTVARKSVRAGAKPLVEAAKRNAPVDEGHLKASMRTSTRWLKKKGSYLAIVKPRSTKGQRKKGIDAWYAHIVIGGAKPHNLNSRNSGHWTARPKPDWADHPYSSIQHPGIAGQDFMWRAGREGAPKAINTFNKHYVKLVEAEAEALPK